MPRSFLTVLLAGSIVLPPASGSPQAADPDLAAGIRQVDEGDYAAAVITLDRAARALEKRKELSRDLARAYLYLGIAYVALGSETAARARFREALAQAADLRLDPEQFPPKVIEIFEKARDESRAAATPPASPPTRAAPSNPAASAGTGKSKLPLILIGVGGAAAAGVALAASGGGGGGMSSPSSTTPSIPTRTEMLTGAVSGGCNSDTVSFRIVPSAAGTLDATLAWTDRDHPITMLLGDTDNNETTMVLARSTPASNTSARMTAPVQNRAYWIYVLQAGGGPCVMFTLTLTYPQ